MIKLYKQKENSLHYWEAWIDGDHVVTHQGVVGQQGLESRTKPGIFSNHDKLVEKLSNIPRKEGYQEIELEDHWTLTIQQKMTDDTDADLDHRNDLIDQLDNMLGWIGAGHVDGGDIGSGTTNIFAFVLAPDQTAPSVLQ